MQDQISNHQPSIIPTPHVSPKAMTVRQFHKAIGGIIGINKLYDLTRCGRLKNVKIGSKTLVLTSEVENFFTREAERN